MQYKVGDRVRIKRLFKLLGEGKIENVFNRGGVIYSFEDGFCYYYKELKLISNWDSVVIMDIVRNGEGINYVCVNHFLNRQIQISDSLIEGLAFTKV